MSFLLDTNVVSELRNPRRCHPAVLAWSHSLSPESQYLSVISVLEIEQGVLRMMRRDEAQGAQLRRWLDEKLLPSFAGRILTFDTDAAKACARMHVPDPQPERDAMISAIARVHGLIVATRNVADFAPMGVSVFNPWDHSPG